MFSNAEMKAKIDALDRSQAIIEFGMDGRILTANANFLNCVGYQLTEVVGQHHRMFVATADQGLKTYTDFWAALNRGEFQLGEFKRIAKSGNEVWLQATYNPPG